MSLPLSERRNALLAHCAELYDLALSKCYTNKKGDEIPNPDVMGAKGVVELAAKLSGVIEVKQPAALDDGQTGPRASVAELLDVAKQLEAARKKAYAA